MIFIVGKSILQVPDTGTRVLDNTKPFLRSSIVSFWMTQYQHVLKDVNITFSGNTGTPEMFQYSPILGRSSIWDMKYTFSHLTFSSVTTKRYVVMVVDRSNYTFFWIVITRGICWYGSRQHRSNFWIKSLYKLSCDPQISCTGCDPAAILNTDPWTHTNIMKLHRLRNRGLGGLSPSIFWVEGPEYPSAPPKKSYILIKS